MANMERIEDRPTWNSMSTPKIMERMETLYRTSKWHDCVFKLWQTDGGGEELVFAHSVILASSSPVFEALCYGPMAEESPIVVPDIDPIAFRMMIQFIYTDSIEFTEVEMACNVLYASKKYLIYTLAGLAISYISYHINESNCLQVHEFASFVHEERLIKESWSYLCSHLDDVLKYFSYESLSKDTLKALVSEEALNGGEMIIFKICFQWAEAECQNKSLERNGDNLRKELEDVGVLNKIRWLTLTLQEFEDGPKDSGILTKEEIEFIISSINTLNQSKEVASDSDEKCAPSDCKIPKSNFNQSDDKKLGIPNSISSVVEARRKIPLKKVYCHRFIEQETRPISGVQNGLKICTMVIANKSVRLTAIFLNGKTLPIPQLNTVYTRTCVIERDYKEQLIISINDSNGKTLFSTFFSEVVRYGTIFKISLQTPVILERLQEYKIQIDLLNSMENYLLGVRNPVSKFPSGLCITFRDQTSFGGQGRFNPAKDLSILSGLELCV